MPSEEKAPRFPRLAKIASALERAVAIKVAVTVLISTGISIFLAIHSWVSPGSAGGAGVLCFFGLAQWTRASRRSKWVVGKRVKSFARRQRSYGIQVSLLGLVLVPMVLLLPSLPMLIAGAVASLGLLGEGVWLAVRSGPKEARLFGAMQFATVCAIAVSALGYSTMAVALEVRDATVHKESSTAHGSGGQRPELTYAELCQKLPDPLDIGHGLGELFKRDGAVRAGCGRAAVQVAGTSAWYSPGVCHGKLRSMAIAGPEGGLGLVYGEAASFAWEEAERGTLVGVETAGPAGGDVDLILTRSGVFGFLRDHQERIVGNENPRTCDEIGGEPEPFTRLNPPMVFFWKGLVNRNTEWIWPERDRSGPDGSVAFVGLSSGETLATGSCESDQLCKVELNGKTEKDDGSSFVELAEVQTFMPPEE